MEFFQVIRTPLGVLCIVQSTDIKNELLNRKALTRYHPENVWKFVGMTVFEDAKSEFHYYFCHIFRFTFYFSQRN